MRIAPFLRPPTSGPQPVPGAPFKPPFSMLPGMDGQFQPPFAGQPYPAQPGVPPQAPPVRGTFNPQPFEGGLGGIVPQAPKQRFGLGTGVQPFTQSYGAHRGQPY